MHDKLYKLIANLLEISDAFEARVANLEKVVEEQLAKAAAANENSPQQTSARKLKED